MLGVFVPHLFLRRCVPQAKGTTAFVPRAASGQLLVMGTREAIKTAYDIRGEDQQDAAASGVRLDLGPQKVEILGNRMHH